MHSLIEITGQAQLYLEEALVLVGVIGGLSELLPFAKKIQANSSFQLVINVLKALAGALKKR